jgi:hypothetical protein
MKIRANLSDVNVELGNKGIVFQIADEEGTPLGRLRIGQATAEWCPANGKMGYGHKAPIKKFIAALETMPRGKG